jgi:beta-glucosidase/6-phospho-beta-glucosidase/beta-galactosidase
VRRAALILALAAALGAAAPAGASPNVRYGIQDDAWLLYGAGSVDSRIDTLDRLGVDLVRFTVDWSRVEPRRGSFDWSTVDPVVNGLKAHGIRTVLTLYGAPRWANGGRSANWAPASGSTFAAFAATAAKRYPWVKDWLIWNEPNQRRWLRPTTPRTYVTKLLNPAYAAIHRASGGVRVAGKVALVLAALKETLGR